MPDVCVHQSSCVDPVLASVQPSRQVPPPEVVQCHVEQRQEEDHEGAYFDRAGKAVQDVQHP